MRAELLAVREECAESVKRFENKVFVLKTLTAVHLKHLDHETI